MKYFGPFHIIQKLSPVAYKLELTKTTQNHNVFHISVLKKFQGEQQTPYFPLPLQTTELGPVIAPHAILGSMVILQNGKEVQQVPIQWDPGLTTDTS